MYVIGLANGLYLPAELRSAFVGRLSKTEAEDAQKLIPGSYLEPYDPFNIYPTEYEGEYS